MPANAPQGTVGELLELIDHILKDPPVNRCADEGCSCPFCGVDISYFPHPQKPHDKDCWLERVRALTSTDLMVYYLEEWDGESWLHHSSYASKDAAKRAARDLYRGCEIDNCGCPTEVRKDGLKVASIGCGGIGR